MISRLPQLSLFLRLACALALLVSAFRASADTTNLEPARALAEATNSSALTPVAPSTTSTRTAVMPGAEAGVALLRVVGALALVIALFLGGVWLFRNWQRLTVHRGHTPKLNVVEVRSLGGRHALYVIGYEQERYLLASTPAGINLLTHLPAADAAAPESPDASAPQPSFAQALSQLLKGGPRPGGTQP